MKKSRQKSPDIYDPLAHLETPPMSDAPTYDPTPIKKKKSIFIPQSKPSSNPGIDFASLMSLAAKNKGIDAEERAAQLEKDRLKKLEEEKRRIREKEEERKKREKAHHEKVVQREKQHGELLRKKQLEHQAKIDQAEKRKLEEAEKRLFNPYKQQETTLKQLKPELKTKKRQHVETIDEPPMKKIKKKKKKKPKFNPNNPYMTASDLESDDSMGDFIDDGEDPAADQLTKMLRSVTGYNPNKFKDESSDDDMEASAADLRREELKSLKAGKKEDREEELAELKRKAMKKKKK